MSAASRNALSAILLSLLAVQIVAGAWLWTATSDEITHLPSGYTYLATGDLRLNPQHPPLLKMLCALPLLAVRPALDLQSPYWIADPPEEWKFGEAFLYDNGPDRLLRLGRLPVTLLAVLLAWIVGRWARELFGPVAGLAALGLAAFSPTLIAHGRLVTMDVGVATFSTAFLYCAWRFARYGRRLDLVLASLALGAALATKFSALLLLPMVPVFAWIVVGSRTTPFARGRRAAALAALVLLGAAVVVWAAYLFPTDPTVYLEGARRVNADHDPSRAYYLFGRFRVGGWWWYFPAAFLVKTPVPTLLLLAASFAPAVRREVPASGPSPAAFLGLPAFLWVAGTCALADNLGIRYLLPVYPLAFVWASRSVAAALRAGAPAWRRLAAGGLAALYLASAAWTFPDQLGYFNLAAGGSRNGWRLLDDSNVDWGQDLRRLASWLDDHEVERVRLVYPWIGRPEHYGIRYERMESRDWYGTPRPGTYAVATVWLIRGLHEAEVRGTPTDWLRRYEPIGRVGTSFFVYRFGEENDPGDVAACASLRGPAGRRPRTGSPRR